MFITIEMIRGREKAFLLRIEIGCIDIEALLRKTPIKVETEV